MHIIDMYEKYENMDKRQIVNALINAEKKEIKMRDELNTHIELVKFLKWRKENPEEARKIREELEMELKLAEQNNENHRPKQG